MTGHRLRPRARRTARTQDGFTLIELLVVVIVVGIIAAIAVPVYLNQREKAVQKALVSDLKHAGTLAQMMIMEGRFPGFARCFDADACAQPGQITAVLEAEGLRLSPGNQIGTKWGGDGPTVSPTSTIFLCVQHSAGGQPDKWVALDTAFGDLTARARHGDGACPWTYVHTPSLPANGW